MIICCFRHILGNFKSKFGFKRERTAFVLTPEMAFVMGDGKRNYRKNNKFLKFRKLAVQAYSSMLIYTFSNKMMVKRDILKQKNSNYSFEKQCGYIRNIVSDNDFSWYA